MSSNSLETGVALQALEGTDCGFTVATRIHGVGKKGFHAKVDVTNVSGAPATAFSVLVRAGAAALVNIAHGSFQESEDGYLLNPLDSLENSVLDPGQTYTYELKFDGAYSELTAKRCSRGWGSSLVSVRVLKHRRRVSRVDPLLLLVSESVRRFWPQIMPILRAPPAGWSAMGASSTVLRICSRRTVAGRTS